MLREIPKKEGQDPTPEEGEEEDQGGVAAAKGVHQALKAALSGKGLLRQALHLPKKPRPRKGLHPKGEASQNHQAPPMDPVPGGLPLG